MALFLIRRIAHGILVLWLITVAVFALFFVAPSNVAQTLAGRQATPETIALIKHRLGLLPPLRQRDTALPAHAARPPGLEAVPELPRGRGAGQPRIRLLPPGSGDDDHRARAADHVGPRRRGG